MTPKITVVVPSYNQGIYLDDCLRSILGQGYPTLELIVVDGGSTDGSVDVIRKHSDSISFWRSEKDDGQASAINEGFSKSTGDVLCWLNSDDMYLPGTLWRVAAEAAKSGKCCWLHYGASIVIKEHTQPDEQAPIALQAATRPFDAEMLTYTDYIVQPSSFWSRALWEAVGPLQDEMHYVFDWEWYLRAAKHCAFSYASRFYSIYRHHPQHKSGRGVVERQNEILQVVEANSPPYWRELYRELERSAEALQEREDWFRRAKIRGRRFALPLFFPRLFALLRNRGDLETALSVWR